MANTSDKILDKFLGIVFSKDKTALYLTLIFLLGFFLRLIAAINLGVAADDMHHTLHAINFFGSGRLITYDQSAGLWHSFTSLMYEVFGVSQLSSRIAALIFGSFSIFAIYLLTKEFFNNRVALIAALLLAIAPFHIKSTVGEMDVMALFFVLSGMVLFIKGLKKDRSILFAASGIFFGLSIYTKVYPIMFLPSLLLYFAYYNHKLKKQIVTKKNVKLVFIFLLFAFFFAIPTLTHNYLLYKDKGFMDLIFTNTLGLGTEVSEQYYSWDSFYGSKHAWGSLILGDERHAPKGFPILLWVINYIRVGDPMNFYLGIFGLGLVIFVRKQYKDYKNFFLLGIVFLLPFLASINLLSKHYLFLEILLVPFAAFSVSEIGKKISGNFENGLKIILVGLVLFSFVFLGLANTGTMMHFYGKSAVGQAVEFKSGEIESDSLVILDSRIYRGRIHWIAQGTKYLEGSEFLQFLNFQEQLESEPVQIKAYYVECVLDDCGWGTVKNQPEFNASMESLTNEFITNGKLVKTISAPDSEISYFPFISEENKVEEIRIYEMTIQLKPEIVEVVNRPKNWFLYDVGYEPKEEQFDYYETKGIFNSFLDSLAHLMRGIAVFLAFVAPIYLAYLFYGKKDEDIVYNNSGL